MARKQGKASDGAREKRLSDSEKLERELAAAARKKIREGSRPTRDEAAALRRAEKREDEELRWEHYRSIPQKHWREMSGRPTKVLHEQAERYDLPFGGRTVDLPELARKLHIFLAANARKLAQGDEVDASDAERSLQEYREERTIIARLERQQLEGRLVDVEQLYPAILEFAERIRRAGELLMRSGDTEGASVVEDAVEEALERVAVHFTEELVEGEPRPRFRVEERSLADLEGEA